MPKLITPLVTLFLTLITLCGCSTFDRTFTYPPGAMLPSEAIQRAAYAAPKRVHGLFYIQVRATGTEHGMVYLNSELDYRDQRNLTVDVHRSAAIALESKLGASLQSSLQGKRLLVRGAARRVKVFFLAGGKPTGKYYYQTHVAVTNPNQIAVQ